MWCRYCGTTKTSRFRTGPCGLLCNAHWKRWKQNKLVLPDDEPTSALRPDACNDYVYTHKRKRIDTDTLLQRLHWYRSQHVRKKTLTHAFKTYEAQINNLRRLKRPKQVLAAIASIPPPPVIGSLGEWLQEPNVQTLPCVPTAMQRRTDYRLASCSNVILQEIQSIRNHIAVWLEDTVPTMVQYLRMVPSLPEMAERQRMALEEQATKDYLEQVWWIDRKYHWKLSWAPHLAVQTNQILDPVKEHVYPHALNCFVKVRPLDDISWLVTYRGLPKRLVRFVDLDFLQSSTLFYHHCRDLSSVQNMDFVFVSENVGWMVTPYHPGGPMDPSHPTVDVLRQLTQAISSFPIPHGALQWRNFWWTGSHRQRLLIRREWAQEPRFEPPMRGKGKQDDLWAMGVLLYKLHTKHYPITPLKTPPPGDMVVSSIITHLLHTNAAERVLRRDLEGFCTPYWAKRTTSNKDQLAMARSWLRYKRRMRWETSVYNINRDDIIGTVFAVFATMGDQNHPVEFQYHDELGQGRGVTRDVYHLFWKQVLDHRLLDSHHGLPTSATCTVCTDCPYKQNYQLLGSIMGKMVLDELHISLPTCRAWTRFMMNITATSDDVRAVSVEEYDTLFRYQQEPNITSFQVQWKGQVVTNETKQEFIQERIQHFLYHGRTKALEHMRQGLVSRIGHILSVLSCDVVHSLIFGQQVLQPSDIPFHWNTPNAIKQWFLAWLTPDNAAQFVQWATGSVYAHRPIHMGVSSRVLYPQAHTCSREVWFPTSGTPQQWTEHLNVALAQPGFSFN